DVTLKQFDFDDISIDDMEYYDALLIGTYSWDDGELPFEIEDFYDDMEHADMTNQIVGVYGSGDSFYETYGGAIKLIWNLANDLGATLVDDPLIIDLEPNSEDEARLSVFAKHVTEKIKVKNKTTVKLRK